jgi:hypothetical protein
MGTIRSMQIAMGYVAGEVDRAQSCERCAHQTYAATQHGRRLPYCQLGGFFVWLDAGCSKFVQRDARRERHG